MINNEDGYYRKDAKRIKFLFLVFCAIGFIFFIYKAYYFRTAKYRYTIAVITGKYNDSKTFGITFIYNVNGISINGDCIDNDCHYLKTGKRYLVKYFTDKPSWNSLYPHIEVPVGIEAPSEGWEDVPNFEKTSP